MIAKRRAQSAERRTVDRTSRRTIAPWAECLALTCLIAFAAALRLWNAGWDLPLLLHPDERPLVEAAWRVAGGNANPGFFRYPSGLIYLLAGVLRGADAIAGPLTEPQRYLLARETVALLGAATAPVVWRWATSLGLRGWALFATALAASTPALAVHSHYATVDVPLTLLFALVGYAITRLLLAAPERRPRAALWAGCAVGLALSAKYTAVLLLPPLALSALVAAPPRCAGPRTRFALAAAGLLALAFGAAYTLRGDSIAALAAALTSDGQLDDEYRVLLRQLGWTTLLGSGALLALALPQMRRPAGALLSPALWRSLGAAATLFVCSSPFVLLDWRHALVDIMYEYRHSVAGAAAQYAAGAIAVQPPSPGANALLYATQLWGDLAPALPLAVLGAVATIHSPQRRKGLEATVPRSALCALRSGIGLGVTLPPLLLLATLLRAGASAERYLLPAYPAICVLAAYGAQRLCQRRPRHWAAALAALCLATMGVALYARLALFALPDTRAQAYAWIGAHLPAGSIVANENYTQTADLRDLPLRQFMADRLYDPARRWETQADYLLLGPAGGLPPHEMAVLRRRYGPPLAVFTARQGQSQGPTQTIFKLRP